MNYFDGTRWRSDVPLPTPRENALLVRAECSLPLANISESVHLLFDRPRRRSLMRKVLRYVQVEGLSGTLDRIRSRRLEARVSSRVFLASYVGRTGQAEEKRHSRRVWCLGTRHPAFSESVLFSPALCFEIPEEIEARTASLIPLLLPFPFESRRALDIPSDLERDHYSLVAGYSLDSGVLPRVPEFLTAARVREAAAWLLDGRFAVPGRITARVLCPPEESGRIDTPRRTLRARPDRAPRAAIVGGGNYARAYAAKFVRRNGVHLKWLVEIEPLLARTIGEAYGFERITTDLRDVVQDSETEIGIVAGYHSTHARDAALLLESGKKVVIEKPAVTSAPQLDRLTRLLASLPGAWALGFNRRYAPGIDLLRRELRAQDEPVTVTCVIHEVRLPPSHWYFWPGQGGRVLGNLCHWVDLGTLLVGDAAPVEIFATSNPLSGSEDESRYDDDVSVTIRFRDGSLVNIVSSSRGDETLGMHEWIQVRSGSILATIDDFRTVTITRNGRTVFERRGLRSRGHSEMYRSILTGFLRNEEIPFALRQFLVPARLTLEIERMLAEGITRAAVGNLDTAGLVAVPGAS